MKNFISIVIATYNRGKDLVDNLLTFLSQEYPVDSFELIVVDDGASDDTPQNIARLKEEFSKNNLVYLRQKNQGPAAARNFGIKNARGKIIAFSDDDCQADKNWLGEIDKSFTESPEILGVGGITVSQKDKITPFTSQVENSAPQSFLTCNVAYKKDILESINGLATVFPYPSNEDSDLAWRVEEYGKISHNPKMIITHPPRPVLFWQVIKNTRYLETEFTLYCRQKRRYQKERKNPWYHIIYICGIKHFFRDIIRNITWLWRNPYIFVKLVLALIIQRIYLILLTIKWSTELDIKKASRWHLD